MLISFLAHGFSWGQFSWNPAAPLPESRAGQATVVVDSLIFVMGGSSSGQHHGTNTVWSYDPATDSWNTNYPVMHHERTNHVAVAVGDTIWVFGGQHTNTVVEGVERYILGAAQWEDVGTMPIPRMGMGIARLGRDIYLIGGKSSNGMFTLPTNRVDLYNLDDGTWSEGPPLSQGRSNFGCAAKGDTIIVAGGSYLDPLLSAERFVPSEGWTFLPNLDGGRSNAAAVFSHNRYVLIGGFSAGGQNMSNLELSNDQWIEFPGLGLPRYNHSAVVYDNTIHVLGGRNGQQTLSSHETYFLNLSVDDEAISAGQFRITNPYPNPFNAAVQFELVLPLTFQGEGYLLISDLLGRETGRKKLHDVTNGDLIRVDFSSLGAGMPSGMYFLSIVWFDEDMSYQSQPKRVVYLK